MTTIPKIELEISGPEGLIRQETLTQESVVVGSGPDATIQVPDPLVSAAHFRLTLERGGVVTLRDLGSEAGTRLRGQPVKEPIALSSGDRIEIGSTTVRIVFGEADATEVVTLPAKTEAAGEERTESGVGPGPERRGAAVRKGGRTAEGALSGFQGPALVLGENGHRLLNEEFPQEEAPSESERQLEIALLWGDTLIEVRTFAAGAAVRIGPGKENDFQLYGEAIGESFELVSAGGETAIHSPPGAKALVRREGKDTAAAGDVRLGLADRCLLTLDTTHLIFRWVKPVKRFKTSFFDSVDFYFTKVLSVAFMVHLVLLIGFWITPLNNELLSEDLFKNPNAFAKLIIQPPPKEKKHKFEDLSGVKEGAKAKGKEGKFGKKEAKKDQAAPSKKGSPIVDAHKREEDRTKIMKAGLLGALGGAEGAASNIFGPGGLGTGINNALGGLKGGAGMGDAHGVGGLGSRGTGPGGGGTALGLGGLGNKGTGHGSGGNGLLDLGGHGKGTTRIVPGRTIVQGSLSKEIIGKIIRRHWNEIKYCYETELNKNPNLYGKVAVAFTIDGAGSVSDANVSETTMNNQNVENCMVMHIRRWRFPEPKGGGEVFVTYPWVFKAAGDDE